jgi:hypothetical protein
LDFQVAPCSDEKNPLTGGPLTWIKSTLKAALQEIMGTATYNKVPGDGFVPVSLRWRTSNELGLPYSPFKVYKRKKTDVFSASAVPFHVIGNSCFFINGPYWQLSFTLTNMSLAQATFQVAPLDQYQQPIAGAQVSQTINSLQSVAITFNTPNINGIVILSGPGGVSNVTGVRMEDLMNDSKWELIETVGMPFKTGTPAAISYMNTDQGYPLAPVAGYQAAVNRVALANLFIKAPKLSQPDGTILPAWPAPKPSSLIDSYHKTSGPTSDGRTTGILYDIEEMLRNVHTNASVFYDARQAFYTKKYEINGFSEDGNHSSEKSTTWNPVCGTTLLGVATDCWNSLGLGFGTTDLTTWSSGALEYDYMVAATFRVPQYNVFWDTFLSIRKYDHFETYEIASLAHPALPLSVVTNLKSEPFSENRPLALDKNFSDDVKLFWDKAGVNVPVAYAIAVKDMFNGQLAFLNADRPFMPGVKRPYLATDRADNDAQDLKGSDAANLSRFFHHRSERSDVGDAIKNYYVAATDVFGRWSAFQKTVSVLPKAPMINADIISGKFIPDIPDDFKPGDPHNYPGVLELVIAWHWDDRTPAEINIGGHFEPLLPPFGKLDIKSVLSAPKIFLNSTNIIEHIDLSICFNGTVPYVKKILSPQVSVPASALEATISPDTTNSAPPHTMAYKIRIKGFKLHFESASKLGYAAYVRSSVQLAPTAFTPYGKPRMFYALDPLPRNTPTLPPDIQWGSLPDATNISRFRVSFPPVANVAGYAIYRATEALLREKLQLAGLKEEDDLFTRRDQLFAFAGEDKREERDIAKDAFIRISSDLIKDPVVDVDLPGDLNGIYIYAMTTFTEQRVESDFSSWLYVAVPRRYTPPAPVVTAFTNKIGTAREVKLRIEVPQGIRTETLDVFSTNKSYLAASPDLMGLPFTTGGVKGMPANWKAYDKAGVSVNPQLPDTMVAYYEITTTVDAGWQPLHYCAMGFGANDKVHGKLPGRSKSSNIVSLQVAPPDTAPEIEASLVHVESPLLRMYILATADIHKTPYGNFRLTVQKRDIAANLYEDVFTIDVPDIKKKQAGDVPVAGSLYRLEKDVSGKYQFEYFVAAEEEVWYQLIITDPLRRNDAVKVHYQNPVVELSNLAVRPLVTSVEVSFDINISNALPASGHYLLEIYTQGAQIKLNLPIPKPVLAYSNLLDNLATTIPNTSPAAYMHRPVFRTKLFTYTAIFKGSNDVATFTNAYVIITVTDPSGRKTTLKNGSGSIIVPKQQ